MRSGQDARAYILAALPTTGRIRLVALRAYYRWCGDGDPTAGLRVLRTKKAPRKPFTDDELRALVAACRTPRERALILCFVATGARLSEIAGMTTGDLRGDGLMLVHGKGAKQRWLVLGKTAYAAIARYLNGREGRVWLADARQTPARYRGMPMATHGVYELIRRIGERAGISDRHPHRFRTTFANRFLESGGDGGALQILLGHSSLAQTMEYAAYGAAERALAQQARLSLADRL